MQLLLRMLCRAHMSSEISLVAHAGPQDIVSFLFLEGACNAFCSVGWVVMAQACHLLLAVVHVLVLALAMFTRLAESSCLATVVLFYRKRMAFESIALACLREHHANLSIPRYDTMHFFFAQQDHLGVLRYIIHRLKFMKVLHSCHAWHK